MNKYTVVTTFNADGYNVYGSKMIDTFLSTWPNDVKLIVYAENCTVTQSANNLTVLDLESVSKPLVKFKNTWKNVPKANGYPYPGAEKKAFKWQAVRFAHKVYAIFHAAQTCDSEWLIWMDADMVCHSPMSLMKLQDFFPDSIELCYAGRTNKFTECGLYGMHLTSDTVQQFLQEFQRMYDDAEQGIFTLEEWHDSFVFDAVRKRFKLVSLNWSAGIIRGEGHPIINSEWGAYIDHLKGNRKSKGRSGPADLVVKRNETYWQ